MLTAQRICPTSRKKSIVKLVCAYKGNASFLGGSSHHALRWACFHRCRACGCLPLADPVGDRPSCISIPRSSRIAGCCPKSFLTPRSACRRPTSPAKAAGLAATARARSPPVARNCEASQRYLDFSAARGMIEKSRDFRRRAAFFRSPRVSALLPSKRTSRATGAPWIGGSCKRRTCVLYRDPEASLYSGARPHPASLRRDEPAFLGTRFKARSDADPNKMYRDISAPAESSRAAPCERAPCYDSRQPPDAALLL